MAVLHVWMPSIRKKKYIEVRRLTVTNPRTVKSFLYKQILQYQGGSIQFFRVSTSQV